MCPSHSDDSLGSRAEAKVALVTGGGRGIGAACCRALAAEGFRVAIHYNTSATLAESLAADLTGAFCIQADLSKTGEIDALIKKLKAEAGRLDVLVNNAGANRNGFMLRADSGRIINISSVVGHTGNGGQVPYSMEKAGLDAMTKSLVQELRGRPILVNSVAPGFIDTAMTQELPEEIRAAILSRIPLERLGEPDEIADVVSFLATRAGYITGTVIHVNGGMYGG